MVEREMEFRVPDSVVKICEIFRENDEEGYLVGGSLRDLLLGKVPGDWDLATTATPEKMTRIFRRVIPTGIEHGTVTVLLGGGTYEITTLRADQGYTDGRHPDSVKFVTDIIDDLSRRDFTINAIAWNPLTGEMYDPFGGRQDLAAQRIVAVGDPRARFDEDGLRIMRAARFAATLQFEIESSTEAAISRTAHRLENVSVERKRDEFQKLLLADRPSIGLKVLIANHLFEYICPDNADGWHRPDWHQVYTVLDALPKVLHLRLAGLWSDTPEDFVAAWLTRFLVEKHTKRKTLHLLGFFPFQFSEEWTDFQLRAFVSRLGKPYMTDFLTLLKAQALVDADIRNILDTFIERLTYIHWETAPLTIGELAINGAELMTALELSPGPQIGVLLRALLDHVLEYPENNTREKLVSVASNRTM